MTPPDNKEYVATDALLDLDDEILPLTQERMGADDEVEPTRLNIKPLFTHYLLPLFGVVVCFWVAGSWNALFGAKPVVYDMEAYENHVRFQYNGSFSHDFNDLNELQLSAAKRIGIDPIDCRESVQHAGKQLVEIKSCENYTIDKLTYSVPFLVPEAARLVDEIGTAFVGRLASERLPLYRPIITSVTRTNEDLKSLRKRNSNTSENSTHAYGTTIDISWKRFDKVDLNDPRNLDEGELKHLLAMVLRDFKQDGRCYVKHEKRQACFHITVIK